MRINIETLRDQKPDTTIGEFLFSIDKKHQEKRKKMNLSERP
jgi:hypothetical protein